MAIGWMTILSNVPWSDVLRNAPAVAEGAKKLWNKVGKKPAGETTVVTDPGVELSPVEQVRILRLKVDELQAQMQASSELIRELAEQNSQLIVRVEGNRRRMVWLAVANLLVAVLAVAAWLR